jgi:polyvinyl alcohol dehydrogenase (cytochrome)
VSAGIASLACASVLAGAGPAGAAAPRGAAHALPGLAAAASGGAWTVYHGDPAGDGVAGPVGSVNTSAAAWTSPALDGQLYGEPLVSGGMVYVATENDTVYALSASTGAVVWSTHLATPVPASSLPCGDITPSVGITGTPVIDASRGEIFVVADELVNGGPEHVLTGLSTSTGAVEVTQDVDPAGQNPANILQRTGLNLDNGRVVFGYGGNNDDCATYHGYVVSAAETGGTPSVFTVDSGSGDSQGAVWMGGGAPAVDGSGNVWVTTGNGSVKSASDPYDDSDGVLSLSPSMTLNQFFAPTTWPSDNAGDTDFSTEPALLSDGQVVASGKSDIVYLLNGADLGGIGGQQAELKTACGGDIDGGMAVSGSTVFLPCLTGITAVQTTQSPATLKVLWQGTAGGGPPILAGGLVWTIGQNGTLYGIDPATGTVNQQASIGASANHFPTPSVADGLLLAPAANRVVAFTASAPAATGEIHAVGAGKCLDVPNITHAEGIQVQIWDCNGGPNQEWTSTSSGQLTVYSGADCLDANANGTTPGTKVQIWPCNGGSNQQWNLNANGTITGVQSGLCLDVNGASTADGALAQLWTCNGGSNQQWTGP